MTDTQTLFSSIQPRYPELSGQVAIVTGSSKGIGKGIAIRLAREGMKVVINSRTPASVEATTAELRAAGADVLAVPGDMGQTADVNRLFAATVEAYGTVDLLVNNAANLTRKHFFEVDEALLDAHLTDNIRGPYICAYRAAEIMRDQQKGGNIVHISSVGGVLAHWRGLPYDVTKGALDAMTRAMALELADFGVRVNAVAPGATATETTTQDPEKVQLYANRIPIRRFGTPLEMGAAVAFLASPDAAYITGTILYVDGGLTVQLGTREQPT